MRLFALVATVVLIAQTNAHYLFNRLIINGIASKEFQYVRDVSGNAGTYDNLWFKAFPIYGTQDPNLKCGRGSFPVRNAATIESATLNAGEKVGFMVSGPFFDGDTQPYIYHEGPGHLFLSKLPDNLKDLNDYDGSGDFFKIGYAGPKSATEWSLNEETSMNATIPKATPPGKYLLRMEQFFASTQVNQSQWFVNCAHIEIVGPGGGTPGPTTRFPNAYADDDPSVWFHKEGTNEGNVEDIRSYVELKPHVWTG